MTKSQHFLLHCRLFIIPTFLFPSFNNPHCQHIKSMYIYLVIYLCSFEIKTLHCCLDLPEFRGSKEVSDSPFFLLEKNLLHNLRNLSDSQRHLERREVAGEGIMLGLSHLSFTQFSARISLLISVGPSRLQPSCRNVFACWKCCVLSADSELMTTVTQS